MSVLDVDLLVAGGGPAGLATAMYAAAAGLRVTVLEPRTAPIDKACGEGLMPGAVAALRALGVELHGRPFAGIRYVDTGVAAESRFAGGPGLGLRRTVLHDAMSRRAAALGVDIVHERAGAVRQRDGHVLVGDRRARHLVAADGLHSPIRRSLGLDLPARGAARFGVRRHFRVAPWTDLVEVHWGRSSEAYVTPLADDLVGVAVLGPRGLSVENALHELPAVGDRVVDAEAIGPDRGAGPLRQRARARVAGRVLLVGDAAGYVDALTGEGVRLALDEAAAAVACLLRDDPEAYEASWRSVTARYRLLTGTLLAAAERPSLRRRIVPAAARLPRVFDRAVASLADSGTTQVARTSI